MNQLRNLSYITVMKKFLIISNLTLIVLVIVLTVKGSFIQRAANFFNRLTGTKNTHTYNMNPNYYPKKEQFDMINGQFDIVMLGNSITEQISWNELLGRNDIANRGISGDITEGMLMRINSVLKLRPALCFLMGGINDITRRVSYDKTLSNITEIVNILTAEGVETVVQSVLYTGDGFSGSDYNNPIITKLNADLKKLCDDKDIKFLDLNARLSQNRKLRPEFTHDGLHLNAEGYAVWGNMLNSFLLDFPDKNSIGILESDT